MLHVQQCIMSQSKISKENQQYTVGSKLHKMLLTILCIYPGLTALSRLFQQIFTPGVMHKVSTTFQLIKALESNFDNYINFNLRCELEYKRSLNSQKEFLKKLIGKAFQGYPCIKMKHTVS